MTIEQTLQERGSRYGDFTDHADICDALINVCSGTGYGPQTNFSRLDPVKRQAIRVICDKLARILSPGGDPEYRDNWHDIQGYAKLAEDRCKDGDAKQQAELPLDPIMPELRAYAKPAECQHGVVEGGYCGECGCHVTPLQGWTAPRPLPSELDPRDGA